MTHDFDSNRNGAQAGRVVADMLSMAAGRRVRSLARCHRGAQSVNYAGVWDDDGSRFALKLVPFARVEQYDRLVEHLKMVHPGVVVRELEPQVRFDIGDYHVLLMNWCDGEVLPFDAFAEMDGIANLVADYRAFLATIQGVRKLYPTYDYQMMQEKVLSSSLADALPKDLKTVDFSILTNEMQVIHGDFQADNLRFVNGRLSGVLDIEEFRLGSPLEDFARYVCQSVDRISWWSMMRWRAAFVGVEQLRRLLPVSAEAWKAAVYGQLLWKVVKKIGCGDLSKSQALRLRWRLRNYATLAGG